MMWSNKIISSYLGIFLEETSMLLFSVRFLIKRDFGGTLKSLKNYPSSYSLGSSRKVQAHTCILYNKSVFIPEL